MDRLPDMKNILAILYLLTSWVSLVLGNAFPPSPVKVKEVQQKDLFDKRVLIATASASRIASIPALEQGQVMQVRFELGASVEKGQTLVIQDRQRRELNLNQAKSMVKEKEARFKILNSKAERSEKLLKSGHISNEETETDQANREAQKASLDQSIQLVKVIEDEMSKCTIKAPFNGMITRKEVETGEWLKQGDAIAEIQNLDVLHLRFIVPEKLVHELDTSKAIKIWSKSAPGQKGEGKVLGLFPPADGKSGSVKAIANLPNPERVWKPGMHFSVEVPLKTKTSSLLISKDAILHRGPMTIVFVVREGVATEAPVQVHGYDKDMAILSGGLKKGDLVVVEGNERLQNKSKVMIKP